MEDIAETCLFCRIATGASDAAIVTETSTVVAFVDHRPIREGHVQIVPRQHVVCFEDLPPGLASDIMHLGQRLARVQKALYGVERVGFVFTGHDVPHVHGHLIPLHAGDDVTSARYIDGSARLVGPEAQSVVAAVLRQGLRAGG